MYNMFVEWVYKRSIITRYVILSAFLFVQIPYFAIIYTPKIGTYNLYNEYKRGLRNAFNTIKNT